MFLKGYFEVGVFVVWFVFEKIFRNVGLKMKEYFFKCTIEFRLEFGKFGF